MAPMTAIEQRTGMVAFQGALGANSHVACQANLPKMDVLPCEDFERAIESVGAGTADLAMIPIENSRAGRVADMHRLLPESGLHIIGEFYQPIHHALVGLPGTKKDQITEAYSHEQALSQCRAYLKGGRSRPISSAIRPLPLRGLRPRARGIRPPFALNWLQKYMAWISWIPRSMTAPTIPPDSFCWRPLPKPRPWMRPRLHPCCSEHDQSPPVCIRR